MEENELLVTADLACIALTKEELAALKEEVNTLMEAFESMSKLDISNIEPTTHALSKGNRVRVDEAKKSAIEDEILEQSPDLEDRFVCIPNVL